MDSIWEVHMRKSGILLHISSLPSPYGIGSFGKAAYDFVDQLKEAGQGYWQVLPMGPIGFGDSPYQSFSAFAGNPYFIDLDALIDEGLLTKKECDAVDFGNDPKKVDYAKMYEERIPLLKKAYKRAYVYKDLDFQDFVEDNAKWLWDYSMFMALKDYFNGSAYTEWPEDIQKRFAYSLDYYREKLYFEIEFYQFLQYKFFTQWKKLKDYANAQGIKIIGDLPFYVAADSADTWSHPELFQLDEEGVPTAVAGCPPDKEMKEGQIWGNPLYNWEKHRQKGYRWWTRRMRVSFVLYDAVRLDHFRAFDEYYSIPYMSENAVNGHWEKGPGMDLIGHLRDEFGDKELIAENLGIEGESAKALLRESGCAATKVLQYAFQDGGEIYLPYNYTKNSVVYTGTHDDEPLHAWAQGLTKKVRAEICKYFNIDDVDDDSLVNAMICGAMSSVSNVCIIPVQDYLNYGAGYRMNVPSTVGDNWTFRLKPGKMTKKIWKQIAELTKTYGRFQ